MSDELAFLTAGKTDRKRVTAVFAHYIDSVKSFSVHAVFNKALELHKST